MYKARDLKTDTVVAMKKVKIQLGEDGVPMNVLREISLLRHLGKYNHPNIVRLLDKTKKHGTIFEAGTTLRTRGSDDGIAFRMRSNISFAVNIAS